MNTVRHEVEVDRRIEEAARELVRAIELTSAAVDRLHFAVGDTRVRDARGRATGWTMSRDEVLVAGAGHPQLARYEAAAAAEATAMATYRDADAQYTGWDRFYLVMNTGGHIHRTMACTTCFSTTLFRWLTDLSGLSEAEAVEAHGAILCTVCFPSAPSAWTGGVGKVEAAEKAVRAAEKAAKAEAKAAKAAARAATHHYGLRKVRASDGEVFDDRDLFYASPTTLKAATRRVAEERGAFWASVEVIDLNTGEVVVA